MAGVRWKEQLDRHYTRRTHPLSVAEKQAIRRVKVRAFVLAAQGNLRAETLVENFLKALPKIRRLVEKEKPPFVAKVSRSGDVNLLQF